MSGSFFWRPIPQNDFVCTTHRPLRSSVNKFFTCKPSIRLSVWNKTNSEINVSMHQMSFRCRTFFWSTAFFRCRHSRDVGYSLKSYSMSGATPQRLLLFESCIPALPQHAHFEDMVLLRSFQAPVGSFLEEVLLIGSVCRHNFVHPHIYVLEHSRGG